MSAPVEVRSPLWPVCWKSCGNCAGEGAFVTEVLIAPGDEVSFNQVIVRTETSKVRPLPANDELRTTPQSSSIWVLPTG